MIRKQLICFVLAIVLAFGFAGVAGGAVSDNVHVVQEGDVLWRIAYAHDVDWEVLAEYNGLENPHLIFPGQVIRIPRVFEIDAGAVGQGDDFIYVEQLAAAPDEAVVPLPEIHVIPFVTEEVVIGEGTQWPLDGYLTMPHGASASAPVPAVVLVHGSGPGDRNQTVFANRPFYDIAAYLSANGVAVLRYDKRTLTHGMQVLQAFGSGLTVWEETVEDAILAADLLRNDPRIGDIFIAGLSLGGMLAPRIHASGGDFDGVIIMAGSPRSLTDIIIDQNWLSFEGSAWIMEALTQQISDLQALVGDVDTSVFMERMALEDLEGYADIVRAWFGLPETISDRDAMWHLLDLLFDGGGSETWQYFYEAGNPEIIREWFEVWLDINSHELYAIIAVHTAAGEPEVALAFLLDYVITQMQGMLTTMYYQLAELASTPAMIAELEEFFATFPYMTTEEAQETEIAPGTFMFAYYFREMMLNPTPYFLEQVAVPMLIMHGDNDLQVYTEADFNLFQELLAGRDDVTFRLYYGLNHLFMPSVATTLEEMLAEYETPSRVYAEVLRDMLEWILGVVG